MKQSTFTALVLIFFCFSLAHGQCLEPANVLIPDKATAAFTSYGQEMDVHDGVLVVSDHINDSLAFKGGIVYVYKTNRDGSQNKLAELWPQELADSIQFGYKVAVHTNTIAVTANSTTTQGQEDIYLYSKAPDTEWASAHETALIPFLDPYITDQYVQIHAIDVNSKFLAVYYNHYYYTDDYRYISDVRINIYDLSGYGLVASLPLPKDPDNSYGSYSSDIALADRYLAVSATESHDHSGAVYIYYYSEGSGWNTTADLTLLPSSEDQYYLGVDMEVWDNNLFVANRWSTLSNNDRVSQVFFYSEQSLLSGVASSDYIYNFPEHEGSLYVHIALNEDYLLLKREMEDVILGYKRLSKWGVEGVFFELSLSEDSMYLKYNEGLVISDHEIFLNTTGIFRGEQSRVNVYHHPEGLLEEAGFKKVLAEYSYVATDDSFGKEIALSLTNCIVGAPGDTDSGRSSGAVYYYQKTLQNEWEFHSKLLPPRFINTHGFGAAVEVTDTYLFVGDPYYDSLNADGSRARLNIGKVFQYKLTDEGWKLESEIISPEIARLTSIGQLRDDKTNFGRVIEYFNGYLAIGQFSLSGSDNVGNVYVYKHDSLSGAWEHKATLKPSVPTNLDYFGGSISMSDSLIVAGRHYGRWASNGYLLVFKKKGNEWADASEDAILDTGIGFASSSSIVDDHTVLAGVPMQNAFTGNTTVPRQVHIFEKPANGWHGTVTASRFLRPSEPSGANAFFGLNVYSNDQYLFVGQPKAHSGGEVFIYDREAIFSDDSITYESQIVSADQIDHSVDNYGVEIQGNTSNDLMIGANFANTSSGLHSGAVYPLNSGVALFPPGFTLCMQQPPIKLRSYPATGGSWSGTGIADSENGIFDPELAGPGSHIVSYTFGGCIARMQVDVYAAPRIVDTAPRLQRLCKGELAELYVVTDRPGDYQYDWYYRSPENEDFQLLSSADIPRLTTPRVGEFFCRLVTPLCSVEDTWFTVETKSANGLLNYSEDQLLCDGENLELKVISDDPIEDYEWYYSDGSSPYIFISNQATLKEVRESGSYFNRFESEECLYYTDTINIVSNELEIHISDVPLICEREALQPVNVSPKGGILTLDGEILQDNLINPQFLENGIYSLHYVIDTLQCRYSAVQEVEITITDIDDLFIPNAFSPNHDRVNETFHIQSTYYDFPQFRMIIVNRNGTEIFSSDNPEFEWSGEGFPSGIYYWYLSLYNSCTEQEHRYSGYVHLLK